MTAGMKLTDLIAENKTYEQLLEHFESKIQTVKGYIDKEDFISEEILRIMDYYLQPVKVEIVGGDFRIKSCFDFSKYAKYGYEWLRGGINSDIEQIIKNARLGTDHPIHDEIEFAKAITESLRKGVAFVLYEQFLKKQLKKEQDNIDKEVMVTYSWDNEEHQQKVLSLTQYLRQEGFAADVDIKLSQEESAIDFTKMMHRTLQYGKVIVILSKGYKEKKEEFKGGVGFEYKLILDDIEKNPKKYILISLEPMSDEIIPFGFRGREIVDMTKAGSHEKLNFKLLDVPRYAFARVKDTKPKLTSKSIAAFEPIDAISPLIITRIVAGVSLGATQYRLIKDLKSTCRAE